MNKVFLKPFFIYCEYNNKKTKLIKMKQDIKLILKDKKLLASTYCEEICYNDCENFCSTLLNDIDVLEKKDKRIDLLLKQFED